MAATMARVRSLRFSAFMADPFQQELHLGEPGRSAGCFLFTLEGIVERSALHSEQVWGAGTVNYWRFARGPAHDRPPSAAPRTATGNRLEEEWLRTASRRSFR